MVVWFLHLACHFGIDFMFINNSNDVFISPGFKLQFCPYQILFARRGVYSLHILMVLIQIWWQNQYSWKSLRLVQEKWTRLCPANTTKIFLMLFNNLCTKSCLNLLLNNSICIVTKKQQCFSPIELLLVNQKLPHKFPHKPFFLMIKKPNKKKTLCPAYSGRGHFKGGIYYHYLKKEIKINMAAF